MASIAREDHASVVLEYPNKNKGETVVVLGGCSESWRARHDLDSVYLLNVDQRNKVWREGRGMVEARSACAAVVCHGAVYAMGGGGGGGGSGIAGCCPPLNEFSLKTWSLHHLLAIKTIINGPH